jgi:hypothetical protein
VSDASFSVLKPLIATSASFHYGKTPAGNQFPQAIPNFKERVLGAFAEFTRKVIRMFFHCYLQVSQLTFIQRKSGTPHLQ